MPLLLMLGVPTYQSAVAHSLLLIVSSSLVAALRYAEDLDMTWHPALLLVGLAVLGTLLGNLIADRYSPKHLQKAFSLMLTLMAGWMLLKVFNLDY